MAHILATELVVHLEVDKRPGAHVLGLFLQPDNLFQVWIGRQNSVQVFRWPWVELLNANYRNVVALVLIAIRDGFVSDFPLARTTEVIESFLALGSSSTRWKEP